MGWGAGAGGGVGAGWGRSERPMTLELDDEDYELLGYGAQRLYEASASQAVRRQEQLRAAWNRYAKSQKGKEATKRRDEKRRASTYFADYYKANAEKVKARAMAYHEKHRNDPVYKAKRAARDRARNLKQKGEKR